MGSILFGARQDDRAIAQLQRTAELEPMDLRARWFLADVYEQKQMYGETSGELQRASGQILAGLESAYRQSGPEGYWTWRLSEARRQNSPFEIARIYARLGDAGQTVTWLEKSYQRHDWQMVLLNGRWWDPVRADPRFQGLLRRMNFPV